MANVFTAEAFRHMALTQNLQTRIQELVEVERDLEWIWYESPPDLKDAAATALSAVCTTTRRFRQALGKAEREPHA